MNIALGEHTLWTVDGQPVRLRSLWPERKAIAVFVRHFGCLFCRQQVATLLPFESRFAAAGADLVIVGQGSVDDARAFRDELNLTCRVLTDPTLEVYCALDLPRGAGTVFRPSVFLRALRARAQGFRQTRSGGDVLQQGGVLIFDKGGSQLYRFVSRSAGEHPSPHELLDVLEGVSASTRQVESSSRVVTTVVAGVLSLALSASASTGSPAVTAVPRVDLDRYAGTWFEVARYENRFQRECASDVTATYVLRPDQKISVINMCRTQEGRSIRAEGLARVVQGSNGARLEVRFAPAYLSWLPLVWADYWVLGLANDYRWAVVGTPDRRYLWILSRTPEASAADFAQAVEVARANGFDPDRLQRTSAGSR